MEGELYEQENRPNGVSKFQCAITIARKIGYECPDNIYSGVPSEWREENYKFHLDQADLEDIKKEFKAFI